jgi:hypothetical protein
MREYGIMENGKVALEALIMDLVNQRRLSIGQLEYKRSICERLT